MKSNKTFVYGRFIFGPKPSGLPPPPSMREEFAIEILREFSARELVGKLYSKDLLPIWLPVDASTLPSHNWYTEFQKKGSGLYFEMHGAGRWEVLHFRNESDETGPYVAVALKQK